MMDFYMIVLLAGCFVLFAAFVYGCGRVVEQSGGERE